MKKLSITKEQFSESRYFQKKYGKLKYVSESGKLFKTNKGKVLKFKESSEGDDPEVQRLAKKVLASMKKMRKTLDDYGISKFSKTYEMPCGDRLEITLKAGRDDSLWAIGGGSVLIFYANYGRHIGGWAMDIDADGHIQYPELYNHTHRVIEAFNIFLSEFSKDFQEYVRHYEDDEFDESSKGKVLKFKESKGLEWLNSFKEAQDFVDKACEQLEIVAFEGGANVGNPIHKKLLHIWGEMRDVVKARLSRHAHTHLQVRQGRRRLAV